MTTQEVERMLEESHRTWDEFQDWMYGQTYGVNEDGSVNWYDHDVRRFIQGLRCID